MEISLHDDKIHLKLLSQLAWFMLLKKELLYKSKGILGKTVGYYVKPEIATNIDNFDHYLLAKIKSKNLSK